MSIYILSGKWGYKKNDLVFRVKLMVDGKFLIVESDSMSAADIKIAIARRDHG